MAAEAEEPRVVVETALRGRPTRISWAFAISAGGHAALLAAFAIASWIVPPKLDPQQKPVSAKLVRLGNKRDPNLLPRKEIAAPPPPRVVEIPGTKPVAIKTRDPGSVSSKVSSVHSRRRLFDAFNKTAKPSSEELAGDPEGDPDGDSDTAEEGERYFGLVLAKARRNYGVTKTIAPHLLAKLKTTVVLYINPSGELIRAPEVQVSSGNEQFDQDVLLALRRAAPFGPPPKHLVDTLRSVGVAIEATP